MKTSFLLGNVQVSFLTALAIFNVALFDMIPNGINKTNNEFMIFKIILCYTAFAFIITFIREIIKDMEDMEGDQKINANTLAIKYGIEKTRKIIVFLILILGTARGSFFS